jgi:hypothetical protein
MNYQDIDKIHMINIRKTIIAMSIISVLIKVDLYQNHKENSQDKALKIIKYFLKKYHHLWDKI